MLNAGKTLWMVLTVVAVAALALPLATRGQNSLVAQDDGRQFISFPQAAANIVVGLKIRTTLVNTGTEPIDAVVSVFDRDGHLVKQDPLTVEPGKMQFSEVSCAAPTRITDPTLATVPTDSCATAPKADDGSTPLRTEVAVRRGDVPNLFIADALACDTSADQTSCGRAQGTTGPTSLATLAGVSKVGMLKRTTELQKH